MTEFIITPEMEERFASARSLEEAVLIFREEGLSINESQLFALLNPPVRGDELTEADLESVAGGAPSILSPRIRFTGPFPAIMGPGGSLYSTRKLFPNLFR